MSEEQQNGGQENLAARTYEPPEEFVRNANIQDATVYERAKQDFEGFWAERARDLHWFKE